MRVRVTADKTLWVSAKSYTLGQELDIDDIRGRQLVASGDVEAVASARAPEPEAHQEATDVPKKKGKAIRSYDTK